MSALVVKGKQLHGWTGKFPTAFLRQNSFGLPKMAMHLAGLSLL
jgi:hypothetical protein